MKSRNMVVVLIVIGVIVSMAWLGRNNSSPVSSTLMAADRTPQRQQWEYARLQGPNLVLELPGRKSVSYDETTKAVGIADKSTLLDVMNALGRDGWELVSATRILDKYENPKDTYTFKRLK